MSLEQVKSAIRDIPDFPKPGVIFKDITPVLKDPVLFQSVIDLMAERYLDNKPDYIVGLDARGFLFGAPLALKLGCGFIPVRKVGKLPFETLQHSYKLEYGDATVEVHIDAVEAGEKVVVVDDLLATGGTVGAALTLMKQLDAEIIGVEFLMELGFLNGKENLLGFPHNSLIVVD